MSCNQTSTTIRIMDLKTIWVRFSRFFFLSLLNYSKPYSPRLKKSTQHHGTWNFNTGTDKVSLCINNIYCKYYKYSFSSSKYQKSFNIPNIQQRLFSTSWLGKRACAARTHAHIYALTNHTHSHIMYTNTHYIITGKWIQE